MSDSMIIPDKIGIEVGWRAWRVWRSGPTTVLLRSLTGGDPWPAHEPMLARCDKGHDPPEQSCTCGLYAARTLQHLQEMGYHKEAIVGAVALWGTIVPGSQGFRAEHAYPRQLLVPFTQWKLAAPLSRAYNVPARLANTYRKEEAS